MRKILFQLKLENESETTENKRLREKEAIEEAIEKNRIVVYY